MIDAAGIGRKIAAAVHREYLQPGVPLQYAVEDQVVQGDGGFEWIADHVVEIEPREPFGVGETVGMDDDERVELFGLLPERREIWLRKLSARDIGQDFHALHAERLHAAFELVRRFPAMDERDGAERDKAVGLAGDVFRQP